MVMVPDQDTKCGHGGHRVPCCWYEDLAPSAFFGASEATWGLHRRLYLERGDFIDFVNLCPLR